MSSTDRGTRRPAAVRWTARLASAGWPIRTAGENGREIPAGHVAFATGILDELPRLTAAHPAQ